mmetsp:Transcript_110035/g.298416  ORF Transcript_110035/g.298416 Transcript_110035/m.298416 type:complete len:323 (-) Transcript_110035:434-1402(-)
MLHSQLLVSEGARPHLSGRRHDASQQPLDGRFVFHHPRGNQGIIVVLRRRCVVPQFVFLVHVEIVQLLLEGLYGVIDSLEQVLGYVPQSEVLGLDHGGQEVFHHLDIFLGHRVPIDVAKSVGQSKLGRLYVTLPIWRVELCVPPLLVLVLRVNHRLQLSLDVVELRFELVHGSLQAVYHSLCLSAHTCLRPLQLAATAVAPVAAVAAGRLVEAPRVGLQDIEVGEGDLVARLEVPSSTHHHCFSPDCVDRRRQAAVPGARRKRPDPDERICGVHLALVRDTPAGLDLANDVLGILAPRTIRLQRRVEQSSDYVSVADRLLVR